MTRLVPSLSADSSAHQDLRAEVRGFLEEWRANGRLKVAVDTWLTGWDEEFTRALAARGWLGMTVPLEYGGQGRSHLERFVVTEELLAAGAPVAAHWVADRQIAPSLLKHGTELQKRRFLPAIVNGECFFGVGMSEPDSGSDLASVRTKAVPIAGGWRVTGTKVWTSGAHLADAFICLVRTSPLDPEDRHAGLTQLIVDLHSPGIDIRPILSMTGSHHFNEVVLDGVFVGDDMAFGTVGDGWQQVTSELGFERSGPERFLSTFPLLADTAAQMRSGTVPPDVGLGRFVGRLVGLHEMSRAVAGALQRGEDAETSAAVVKVLGTTTEGDIAEFASLLTDVVSANDDYFRLVEEGLLQRPGFTLRGGTNEILRGVIARGLGMR